jgi:uncharacterized protein DUF402
MNATLSFSPGQTIVRRFLYDDGRLAAVHACHVVSDDVHGLLLRRPAGSQSMRRIDLSGRPTRHLPLKKEMSMATTLAPFSVADQDSLIFMPPGASYSVHLEWSAAGAFIGWYVNFELGVSRWSGGLDLCDQIIDLVVHPDRTWIVKDRDEFEDTDMAAAAKDQVLTSLTAVIQMVAAECFPFDLSSPVPEALLAPEAHSADTPALIPAYWDDPGGRRSQR